MSGTEARTRLPKKLGKQPLVEAIFEMRFESQFPVSTIWPGILYSSLAGDKIMEQLPSLSIPKEIRDADPNFAYVPVCRISWGNYWILIGDKVFAVATKIPYNGWDEFKAHILGAYTTILQTGMIKSISRCSMKCIDILDSVPFEASECFRLQCSIGERDAAGSTFHVNIGFRDQDILHTLQVISLMTMNIVTGGQLVGPLLDVDSVMELGGESSDSFLSKLSERADKLHDANKRIVFDSLSEKALEYLEPVYE
ncbi:TIGR04255 family protein [Pseudomonas sp. V104_10]|uniref:TIGR04255 family protein n=1 Tax=Pseudomonas sp. V104_10 TaxID=3044231 RepID=UPI00249E5533|nr:TIGR04255 family protein [Pseudomonas sp. V104_10]MDI3371629.1 TIGR04255 family protein [Pseudomonas sp. V104_10]